MAGQLGAERRARQHTLLLIDDHFLSSLLLSRPAGLQLQPELPKLGDSPLRTPLMPAVSQSAARGRGGGGRGLRGGTEQLRVCLRKRCFCQRRTFSSNKHRVASDSECVTSHRKHHMFKAIQSKTAVPGSCYLQQTYQLARIILG